MEREICEDITPVSACKHEFIPRPARCKFHLLSHVIYFELNPMCLIKELLLSEMFQKLIDQNLFRMMQKSKMTPITGLHRSHPAL